MSEGAQTLMIIHDASRNDGLSAIILNFESLPVRSGDALTLLGVIHHHPSPCVKPFIHHYNLTTNITISSFIMQDIIMHFTKSINKKYNLLITESLLPDNYVAKIKSMIDGIGSHNKSKDDEQLRKEEYLKRQDVIELGTISANKKIKFNIDVQTGSSPKKIAAKAAKGSGVTWVVLDRQMKKDRKYFMGKLASGILKMKRDNTIEKLRGPILMDDKKQKPVKRTISSDHVSYGEMIPVMSKHELSTKKTPVTQKATNLHKTEGAVSSYMLSASMVSTSSFTTSEDSSYRSLASMASTSSFTNKEISGSIDTRNSSIIHFHQDEYDSKSMQPTNQIDLEPYDEQDKQHKLGDALEEDYQEEEFEYSVCSVCENKRPNIRLKKDFSYAELQQATNGFSSDKFLSEGGFGSVYEGTLKCGLKVAVKQHKDVSSQGEKEFKSEVNVLSKARHPNLVMLLGSCSEGTHRLLVYEFVCNGSLDQHLSSHELTWDKRIKIALGAARGLDYLHSISIIHRDMRPNNILVTHDYEPLLGDFGLARTVCVDTDETGVVGTLGYVAPEYAECGKVSTKTDVYSFGVVLLQLITGCKTKEEKFEDKSLVEWARPLLEEKNYPDLIDEKILDSQDVHVFQLYLMVKLAEGCLKNDPTKRETMEDVVQELECIKEGTTRYRELKQC